MTATAFARRSAAVVVVLAITGCLPPRTSSAPALVAVGTWVGWGPTADDSAFAIAGAVNGHLLQFVVDYGANAFQLADRMYDSLQLPRLYANATRVQVMVRRPGVEPVLDTTANVIVQHDDTVTEYWGDFEPLLADSVRIGRSLQQHVLLSQDLSYASFPIDGIIGRDMLSQFDVEFGGPARSIRLYQPATRPSADSKAHRLRWLPPGLTERDCVPAVVIGPKPLPTLAPADTAGLSVGDKRQAANELVAARRLAEQRELRFPVVFENHAFTATFDSGTRDAIMNTAAARAFGFVSGNPRVQVDPSDSTHFVVDVTLRAGAHELAAPRVWIADAKFEYLPDYETTPMLLLGLTQFRNRVLFMSHSTGTVCIGPAH